MLFLKGKEKAVLKVGDRYVKLIRAHRNGDFEMAVTEDDSERSLQELYRYQPPLEPRLPMPKVF